MTARLEKKDHLVQLTAKEMRLIKLMRMCNPVAEDHILRFVQLAVAESQKDITPANIFALQK